YSYYPSWQPGRGEVGYNPRYHGRPSIKAKACFIAETAELVNLKAYGGKTHSNGEFLNFFKEAEGQLPHNYVPKGVRMDKGFFDEKNFEYFESRTLLYVCKAPMRSGLKKIVNYLKEQNLWQELDECYSIAELTVPLPSWNKARRFIVICQKKDPKTGQLYIDHPECYQYQAIVTNIETNDMSPEEVWHFYNKRGTCELWINELKDGFAVDEASQHTFVKNEAYMLVKAISYNLMLWFKEATMPDEVKNCRAVASHSQWTGGVGFFSCFL
ncbi:transposase, partial [Syntrophaceticus schinkii]